MGGNMLGPVIMVGCGGSGIKSVRYVREAVLSRLAAAGWDRPMPEGWQFIGLDTLSGQSDLGEVPPLPTRDYLQVTAGFHNLTELYMNLRAAHRFDVDGSGYSELVGWLPSSTELPGDLTMGAGKLRAVGRALGTYALTSKSIKKRFEDAFAACESGAPELSEVSRILGIPVPPGEALPSPLVIVVGSSAGGTGAGVMLDTMDMLRRLSDRHITPISIVYGPDIFGNVKTPEMVGNSIGFMSEMLSAFWATNAGPQGLFPAPLIAVADRGPHAIFMVGKSNMAGTELGNAATVYRAVGETLGSWVTSDSVTQKVREYVIANKYADQALGGVGFGGGHFKGAVTSFGSATIAVGRTRFRSYAKANLMYEFYNFHWSGWRSVAERTLGLADSKKAQPIVLEEVAKRALPGFLEGAGLLQAFNPDGRVSVGMTEKLISSDHSRAVATNLERALSTGLPTEAMGSGDWQKTFQNKIALVKAGSEKDARDAFEARLTAWSNELAEKVLRESNELVTQVSLPIAIKVIEKAIQELQVTAGKFKNAADVARTNSTAANTELWTAISSIGGTVKRDAAGVTAALKAAGKVHSHDMRSEALMRLDNALLLVVRNLLQPIKSAMQVAYDGHLTRIVTSTQKDEPAAITQWPKEREIPSSYLPSKVEFLLEDFKQWPDILNEKIEQCVTPSAAETVRDAFRRVIVTGDRTNPDDRPPLLWPEDKKVVNWNINSQMNVEFRIDLESMDSAISHWMNTNSAMSSHLSEGLNTYLGDKANVRRLDDFEFKFRSMLQQAKPLIEVDQTKLTAELASMGSASNPAQADPVLEKLPFPINHPARDIAEELLRAELGLSAGSDMTQYFTDGDREAVVVSSWLSQYIHPSFVKTFTEPLATELMTVSKTPTALRNWFKFKRARTLNEFVPVPAVIRLAFIRGFVVGRLLGQISINENEPVRIAHGGETFNFPSPLLSPVLERVDTLPALLESFSLEFANVPTKGMGAFSAYGALYHKAVPVPPNDLPTAFTVGGDLKKFIDTGMTDTAPIDNEAFTDRSGSTSAERQQKIIENLEAMVSFYQELKKRGATGQEMRMGDGNIEDPTRVPKEPGVKPEYGYVSSLEIIDELIGQYSTVLNVVRNYVPGSSGSVDSGLTKPPV
jgi:hypothetical protein